MAAVPDELPPADQLAGQIRPLVEQARRADAEGDSETAGRLLAEANQVLDGYAPAIDEYADAAAAGAWLGMARNSVYRERARTRAGGEAGWPAPDLTAGRSGLWKYRTLVLHRAGLPGRGAAGRGRPRRAQQ